MRTTSARTYVGCRGAATYCGAPLALVELETGIAPVFMNSTAFGSIILAGIPVLGNEFPGTRPSCASSAVSAALLGRFGTHGAVWFALQAPLAGDSVKPAGTL